MAQINIEVIGDVTIDNRGKFTMARVNYKGPDGKVDSKQIPSFDKSGVYKILSSAQNGDRFTVNSEKGENGYWQWTACEVAGKNTGGSAVTTGSVPAPRSNFETPDERAARQVYIVRQSSISSAIALAASNKEKAGTADIIESAKAFESFVFGTDEPLPDDVEIK